MKKKKKRNKSRKSKPNKKIHQLFKQQRQSSPRSNSCSRTHYLLLTLCCYWVWLQFSASSRTGLGELVWETAPHTLICATKAPSDLQCHPRESYAPNKLFLKIKHSKILEQVKTCCVKAERALMVQAHLAMCTNLPHQFLAASSLSGLSDCQLLPKDKGRDVFLAPNS